MKKANIKYLILKLFVKYENKLTKIILVNTTDPIAPEIVLFGLIFVSFGPPIKFPKIKPPTSDPAQLNNIIKRMIFSCKKFEKKKKKKQKQKIKKINKKFINNNLYLFLIIFCAKFINSRIDNTPRINNEKISIGL